MACCAFKRSFSSNDNSDASFEKMLVNIAYYLTPIRPGRKDQRNMKAKMVIGFHIDCQPQPKQIFEISHLIWLIWRTKKAFTKRKKFNKCLKKFVKCLT